MPITDHRPTGILKALLRAPIWLYRARLGFVLGHRFLYVAHRGRVSGKRRETVVEVVEYDKAAGRVFVVAGWGAKSDWFCNLQAGPALEVRLGARRYPRPGHHILDPTEALELLTRYRADRPATWRQLAKIMGFSPDADGAELTEAARTLPAIRFDLPT